MYFFMQRKLDDSFDQILELEKRLVEVEVDGDRLDAKTRARRGRREAFKEAAKQKELERADAEDKMRALRPVAEAKERWT